MIHYEAKILKAEPELNRILVEYKRSSDGRVIHNIFHTSDWSAETIARIINSGAEDAIKLMNDHDELIQKNIQVPDVSNLLEKTGYIVKQELPPAYDDFFEVLVSYEEINGSVKNIKWRKQPLPENILQTKCKELFEEITQSTLNSFAEINGYDNIEVMCTYKSSNHPEWSGQGFLASSLRDYMWDEVYSIINKIDSGEIPMPANRQELFSLIPPIDINKIPDWAKGIEGNNINPKTVKGLAEPPVLPNNAN